METNLKYPVVLVHGLGALGSYGSVSYFYGLRELLSPTPVFTPSLASWNTIEVRAAQLKEQIIRSVPDGKVNIIAHSLGGLDARYMISKLDFAEQVASLTTIGTPHQGTSLGDFFLKWVPTMAFSSINLILEQMDLNTHAIPQVTRKYCQDQFNPSTPNHPSVAYFSAMTAIASPVIKNALPIFWASHRLIQKREGDNDGFVSVQSSRWGETICTYPGDHYAQIGQIMGRTRGLDYIRFYKEILSHLRKNGM